MTKDEALRLAWDALQQIAHVSAMDYEYQQWAVEAITAIKEALAQPEQEPVAWEQFYPDMGKPKLAYLPPSESPDNACYTPPQRTWVGLTRMELIGCGVLPWGMSYKLYKAIEAKLKERNS